MGSPGGRQPLPKRDVKLSTSYTENRFVDINHFS